MIMIIDATTYHLQMLQQQVTGSKVMTIIRVMLQPQALVFIKFLVQIVRGVISVKQVDLLLQRTQQEL